MDVMDAVDAVDTVDTGTQWPVDLSALTPTAYWVPTAYCIPHCVGFDLFALKVMVPTTHIC